MSEWYQENREKHNETQRNWESRNPEKTREYKRNYVRRNKKKVQDYHYRTKYGLTLEEAEAMKSGGCEICGSHDDMAIDHDHETGEVRGALCGRCNRGIGHMDDDIERLLNAAKYLEAYRERQQQD
jgi:hypothetical protein